MPIPCQFLWGERVPTGQAWVRHFLLELECGLLTAGGLRLGDEMSMLLPKERGVDTRWPVCSNCPFHLWAPWLSSPGLCNPVFLRESLEKGYYP